MMQSFIVFMGNRKLLGLFRGSRFESVRYNSNGNTAWVNILIILNILSIGGDANWIT